MDYSKLLDLVTELGYALSINGAETFRVEESVIRILRTYGIEAEVFAIPNCLHICIEPVPGKPISRMKRIGDHGNDLDAVERFSGLSRRICAEKPTPEEAFLWFEQACKQNRPLSLPFYMLAHFIAAFGFCFLFGGTMTDAVFSGVCALVIALMNKLMQNLEANLFFSTMAAAFPMAFLAYGLQALGLAQNADTVTIGALMLLVPGLLITNAMRDIIFGDTNSGVNRLAQVLLIAIALGLGTAAAWNCSTLLWNTAPSVAPVSYSLLGQMIPSALACLGFALLFNIKGPGTLLCALGGVLSWAIYLLVLRASGNDLYGYFASTLFSAIYAESMARIRKYPAISYLVVSIIPMIPGTGVYYTMRYAVAGDLGMCASTGMHTAAIAGVMAVSILLVSTTVRLWTVWKTRRKKRR